MANKIVNVSDQQRVVFVDNINNTKAAELSSQYPFGMFLGNGPTGLNVGTVYNHDTGLIYKNGKRYSLVTSISKKPIQINTGSHIYNLRLQIDDNGILSLSSTPAIEDFILDGYTSNGQYYQYTTGDTLNLYDGDKLYFYYIDSETHQVVYYPTDDLLTFNGNGYISLSLDTTSISSQNERSVYVVHTLIDSPAPNAQTLTIACDTTDPETSSKDVSFYSHYLSSGIFYIGSINNITDNMNVFDDDLSTDLNTEGWHSFDYRQYPNLSSAEELYSYYTTEDTGFNITDIDDFCIILPDTSNIYLPMRYNTDYGPLVEDYIDISLSLIDGSFDRTLTIHVNGMVYYVYKYKNGLSNTKFINYIK